MTIRMLTAIPIMLATACTIGDPPADPSQTGHPIAGGTQPDGGTGSGTGGGSGSGTGSGSGGSTDQGVPPMVTTPPVLGQQSACGGVQPITLQEAATTNGCNLAAGTTSRCPAPLPAGESLDAIYTSCLIAPNASDCQPVGPYVECPVGEVNGPLDVLVKPPAGQPGYGFEIDIQRVASSGSIAIQWQAYELGVRADGSIAWQGPHAFGQTAVSTSTCCDLQYTAYFPGSGYGEKIDLALQWF